MNNSNTSSIQKSLLQDLKDRGFIHDASHFEELDALLQKQKISFYCGFDPTADSLHVGHMLPLMMMRKFQRNGHTPIALVGSATGMIGDPSGKSEERNLLTLEQIQHNVSCVEKQIEKFLEPASASNVSNGFCMVRNHDWLGTFSYIDFLRIVGKHFSVNAMMAKDSVRSRLENREQGISYTEFSYMLLQAYDFYHLHKHNNCTLQIGGSDQWGNITAGIDLIRKINSSQGKDNQANHEASRAFGLTFPLLTTSSGKKFGKTEAGAVWLDPRRTSPYKFYQYWLNSSDDDVIRYIELFTDLSQDEITELTLQTKNNSENRTAQKRLAIEITTIVHGQTEAIRAQNASQVLFGGDIKDIDSKTLLDIFSDVPSTEIQLSDIKDSMLLVDLLVKTQAVTSKSEARRLISGGGIYTNSIRVEDVNSKITQSDFIDKQVLIIRLGKKNYHVVTIKE